MRHFVLNSIEQTIQLTKELLSQYIGEDEWLIFETDLPPEQWSAFFYSLRPITEKSKQSTLLLNEANISPQDILTNWGEASFKYLLLRWTPLRSTHSSENSWLGTDQESDFVIENMERLRQYQSALLGHKVTLIPEVSIDFIETEYGPLLAKISNLDIPFIALHSSFKPNLLTLRKLQDVWEHLTLVERPQRPILFLKNQKWGEVWNAASLNPFAGPEEIHIDTSNSCTHSCVFCPLYSSIAINEEMSKAGGNLSAELKKMMSMKLSMPNFESILSSSSPRLKMVQLGGKGDPLLNPHFYDFVTQLRKRNIMVETLSNLEYPDDKQLEFLTSIGGAGWHDLHIVVNLSAATPETYVHTRPKQKPETFAKVIHNVEKLTKMKKQHGRGVSVTLMCVLCTENYHEAVKYVELAASLNVEQVWLKPVEIHRQSLDFLSPKDSQLEECKQNMVRALDRANELGIRLMEAEVIESYRATYPVPQLRSIQASNQTVHTGNVHSDYKSDLYSKIPCRIGYTYSRIEVSGIVKPCCVSRHSVGDLNNNSFEKIWNGASMLTFRNKLGRIRQEKFHQKDPQWAFCQHCSHTTANKMFFELETQVDFE